MNQPRSPFSSSISASSMLPFAQEKRRKINLGGETFVASQTDILHSAKARRSEREEIRRRHESALCIQTHWRSSRQSRAVKRILAEMFHEDVLGLNGMRTLVLIRNNESLLAQWSDAVIREGDGWSLRYVSGPDLDHWIVLIRRMAVLLLLSVANSPQAPASSNHLLILDKLLSPKSNAQALGAHAEDLRINITGYLLRHGLYPLLGKALGNIPVDEKGSPSIPRLVSLITHPLRTFGSSHPDEFLDSYASLIRHILTLPLLPNRLPLNSLTQFSANLPLSAASVLSPSIPQLVSALKAEEKVHLLANIAAFVPPRYSALPSASLTTLLHLSAELMSTLPHGALEPKSSVAAGKPGAESESDSDSEDLTHTPSTRATRPSLPRLDERTSKRLQMLPAPTHISSLIRATQSHAVERVALCDFLFSLCTAWPLRVDSVLSTIVVSTGGGFVRELYRGYVRSSPVGKEVSLTALMDSANADTWLPLLFLTDLYTHSLLTMGDDEFFSGLASPARANAPRNPLTLDEIISLSRKLLNIAFTLFWREGQIGAQDGYVTGLNVKWETVRRKVTRFLQAIHARDSRRPFTPPGHWLVNEHIDIELFIVAAKVEEQQFGRPVGARPYTRRSIADLSPRLGVLNNIPFAIPFEARVKIFRSFIQNDKENIGVDPFHSRTRATVRRGHVAEDGFDKLGDANLKQRIEISFIDQFGETEMGIDGGGVFKEFFTDLSKEVFDSNRGLWLANKKNELYPNHGSYATEPHSLRWYRFIGKILGKALYEGILVDVAFAGFFLAKWLGKQSFLDDLASLDPDLYQGLIFLKHYPGNPEELSLNFTIVDEEFGVTRTIDLKPNGSNIPVTRDNKFEYIFRVSHYRLTKQIKEQSVAFFEGLSAMIDPKWLRMFNQQELQVLLGGVNTPIDVDDLRRNTNYGGGYNDQEPTIVAFWKVVEGFDAEQRQALLRFVTSVGRPPLLGFSGLFPKFCIRDAGLDENRLPTSSTCVNLLKLPRYRSEDVLRRKLLQAVHSGAGFDLS
ncbi:HECT-domain-containing protein [Russula earlei]|uniref:HECT-domain-containing protein n=1 Tax=Russula earlei TaxID=71964 RepID=A0ACC0UF50_9AGAM|nr:HECT-domain-containing protein [Russula earlei]